MFCSFVLETNKDGYFKVGKVTKGELSELIYLNDIILSINDQDLRELQLNVDDLSNQYDISDFFEEEKKLGKIYIVSEEKHVKILQQKVGAKKDQKENKEQECIKDAEKNVF